MCGPRAGTSLIVRDVFEDAGTADVAYNQQVSNWH